MKLKQYHGSGYAFYEITDVSLKIESLKVLDKEKHEVFFEDILIDDLYYMKANNKEAFAMVTVLAILFWEFVPELFFSGGKQWIGTAVLGVLLSISVYLFLFPKTKVHIPTKKQGIIRLYAAKPSEKAVKEFIYMLEGKVHLITRSGLRKEKIDLSDLFYR